MGVLQEIQQGGCFLLDIVTDVQLQLRAVLQNQNQLFHDEAVAAAAQLAVDRLHPAEDPLDLRQGHGVPVQATAPEERKALNPESDALKRAAKEADAREAA